MQLPSVDQTPEQPPTRGVGSSDSSAVEMQRINSTHYAMAQDGRTLAREEKYNWFWVLRDSRGEHIDHDRYRADLAERNRLRLLEPNVADEQRRGKDSA